MPRKSSRAALAAALIACAPLAAASPNEADFSDLWWNAGESGWGVGLQRQGDVIFLTLFVYGADGRGTWFVAPDVRMQASSGSGSLWQGPLLRARGPGFASAFDATAVEAAAVGNATLEFADAQNGTLRYTVDGVPVTKAITRMTWRAPSPEGRYHGGFSAEVLACADVTRVGQYDFLGPMTVTRTGSRLVAQFSSDRAGLISSCNFDGEQEHGGRYSRWSGQFNCNVVIGHDERGENVARATRTGPFTVDAMTTSRDGFYGELTANDQDCAFGGRFGGTRMP